MENFMKRKKLAAIVVCLLMVFQVACSEQLIEVGSQQPLGECAEREDRLENTDYDAKIVGSRDWGQRRGSYFSSESLEELVASTYAHHSGGGAIIIGRVESVEACEIQHLIVETYIDLDVVDYTIVVYETLFGEVADTIMFSVPGFPDCHIGMTKPNIGDMLLLFLWQRNDCEYFELMQWEESVLRIDEDGTLYSFSDDPMTARFDGVQLEALTSEIEVALDGVARGEILSAMQRAILEFEAIEAAEMAEVAEAAE
jgi:hypothetical protein